MVSLVLRIKNFTALIQIQFKKDEKIFHAPWINSFLENPLKYWILFYCNFVFLLLKVFVIGIKCLSESVLWELCAFRWFSGENVVTDLRRRPGSADRAQWTAWRYGLRVWLGRSNLDRLANSLGTENVWITTCSQVEELSLAINISLLTNYKRLKNISILVLTINI